MKPDSGTFTSAAWPALTAVLTPDAVSPACRQFVKPLLERSDLPQRLARMALMFREKNNKADAEALAKAARILGADDHLVLAQTDWLIRRQVPIWHFPMALETGRNNAYQAALQHFVKPTSIVFEIGTGSGILTMLAAQAGAAHVYSCEKHPQVAETARDIIAKNGFGDCVTVLNKAVEDVVVGEDMPEPADILLSDFVDNSLLGPGVAKFTELARKQHLKPDAVLLPQQICAMGCLVSGQGLREYFRMGEVMGFDLSGFNRFRPLQVPLRGSGHHFDMLSEPGEMLRIDLGQDMPPQSRIAAVLTAHRSGLAEGILQWRLLDFGNGITFDDAPPKKSAWALSLYPLPQPRELGIGDKVEFEVYYEKSHFWLIF